MDLSYLVGSRGSLAQHVGGPGRRQHGKGAISNIKKKQKPKKPKKRDAAALPPAKPQQQHKPQQQQRERPPPPAAAPRGALSKAEKRKAIKKAKKAAARAGAAAAPAGGATAGSWDRAFAQADAADGGDGDADDDDDEEEQDSDYDEELAEHGSFVPDRVGDPKSATAAAAAVGRRVYFDGLEKRRDLNGSGAELVAWRGKQWEVECDHGDEHILVPSGVLRWLDQAPPPRSERGAAPPKKKAKKPKR